MLQVLRQVNGASEYRGKGGRVTSTMNVNPGDTLYLYVGGIGSSSNGGSGGWNGGGNGGNYCGGGGASDIRINGTELVNRVIVAGGGGSNGSSQTGTNTGGHGGGLTGGAATNWSCVSYGGRQYRGGTAPSCGYGAGRSGSFLELEVVAALVTLVNIRQLGRWWWWWLVWRCSRSPIWSKSGRWWW